MYFESVVINLRKGIDNKFTESYVMNASLHNSLNVKQFFKGMEFFTFITTY